MTRYSVQSTELSSHPATSVATSTTDLDWAKPGWLPCTDLGVALVAALAAEHLDAAVGCPQLVTAGQLDLQQRVPGSCLPQPPAAVLQLLL